MAAVLDVTPENAWTALWRRLQQDRVGAVSLGIVVAYLVMILFAATGWLARGWSQEVGVPYANPAFLGDRPNLEAALQKNSERDRLDGQLISVDPNPERFSQNGWENLVVQIPKAVQELELEFFDSLEKGDTLFIDSSHIVGTGSDVAREYLQILPRLKPGVLVHIHDIFLPADYPREAVLNNLWFWSEQYLLQAFLSFNSEFEVLWSSSTMQIECPQVLEKCFPSWRHSFRDMPKSKRRFVPTMDRERVWPSSFWMRRR